MTSAVIGTSIQNVDVGVSPIDPSLKTFAVVADVT